MSDANLEYISCPTANCGGQWLPDAKLRHLRESHEIFYCPSGHSQWFAGKTEKEKRIEELEKKVSFLTVDRNFYKGLYERERQAARNARQRQYALKGVITRLKRTG